jgi:MurNAc alpha-1-phosphate uridylyltransferase
MKAMILAAGYGRRMAPVTDHTPKPLLEVGGQTLIERHILRLKDAGFADFVINLAHLGEQIRERLGGGERLGVSIVYSAEGAVPLETGGGIRLALPLLGEAPFAVINGDVWTDYDFLRLPKNPAATAHLVLVDNPTHNPDGDFGLAGTRLSDTVSAKLTFAGIGVYRPELFAHQGAGPFPLSAVLRPAISRGEVTGERHAGAWFDVGTAVRLEVLRQYIALQQKA